MDIHLADVTLHVDEELGDQARDTSLPTSRKI